MTVAQCVRRALLGSACFFLAVPAGAQDEQAGEEVTDDFIEIAPPEAAFSVRALDRLLVAGSNLNRAELKSVISATALPDTSLGPIGVCFVDGDPDLFDDVIRFAKAWELSGTSIRFDFGSAAMRYCPPNATQLIRISFAGKGTWSVIGLEGRIVKGATMNFSSLESWNLVGERRFRRAVQHEFGHALGLYHEHQNPNERCHLQIDWPRAGALYRGKGFNLTDEEIRVNLGVLTSQVVGEGFDLNSIMLYDLPRAIFKPELFVGDAKPSCYAGRVNFAIAPGDIETIRKYFSQDPAEVRRQRQEAFERARAAFKPDLEGRMALAIVSSYYPFRNLSDATPFVTFARDTIAAQAEK